jgi:Mrp family chromosome partitioning ATPase/capsular polysaccharide biosynthesis protein
MPLDVNQAETELQVIKSERLLTYVFDSLKLSSHPDSAIQPPGTLDRIRAGIRALWGSSSVRPFTADEARQIAFDKFGQRVGVRRVGQSYVVEVSFTSSDPILTPRVANAIISAYLWQSLASKADKAKNGAEFVQGRVNALTTQVDAAAVAVTTGALPLSPTPDADARIIGAAVQPLGPSAPRRGLIIALGGIMGLTTGFFILTISQVFGRRIGTPEALMRATGLPCLATVPEVSRWSGFSRVSEEDMCALVSSQPDGKFASAIRDIRTSIMLARSSRNDGGNDAIALVSWKRDAGCTLICANLAHMMRESGDKITIIDADIRNNGQKLTDQVPSGTVSAPLGLADALTSDTHFDDLTLLDFDGVGLLPAGSTDPRRNRLAYLSIPKMAQIIEAARSRSEVLVDLPPLSVGADARAAVQHTDAVLLVVVAGQTTGGELVSAVQALRGAGANVIGAVLNRASE